MRKQLEWATVRGKNNEYFSYEINSNGRVFRHGKSHIVRRRGAKPYLRYSPSGWVTERLNAKGQVVVTLCDNEGKRKTEKVSDLMKEAGFTYSEEG